MKSFNVEVKLYSFNELEKAAMKRAIEEHRSFLLSVMTKEDFISGDAQYDTEDELSKTYNAEYDYISTNDEPVIESIEINEYLFFNNGELASCTTYIGEHPKAGTTECKFMGTIYNVA